MSIEPTPGQLERLASADDRAPVVMLNLLRFKERADGIDAADGVTGAEAYARYSSDALRFLARAGGRILWAATPQESVIGPDLAEWDLVVAVEYPTRAAFLRMISDPEYLETHGHRAAALEDSRLIACKQLPA